MPARFLAVTHSWSPRPTSQSLWENAQYFHPDVRGASTRSLAHLVACAAKAEGVPPYVKGAVVGPSSLPPATKAIHGQVVPALVFFRE